MSSNNQTEQLFEVTIRVQREPLPPYWETFLINLTSKQAKDIIKTLETCGESAFIAPKQQRLQNNL